MDTTSDTYTMYMLSMNFPNLCLIDTTCLMITICVSHDELDRKTHLQLPLWQVKMALSF
jgi:hypothetical protein